MSYVGSFQPGLVRLSAAAPQARPAKRALDIVLGGLLLGLALLPMVLIGLAIRLETPGPALFRQRRIGKGGRPFLVLKFRTMHVHPAPVLRQATRGDARVTRLGAILRRLSIDELPQLINVLRGEMSLVGPRPHAPGTCAAGRPFEVVARGYDARHLVLPGMTGLAQIRGWRGETATEEALCRRVDADLEYIARWSLALDLAILLRTIPALLRPTNAW
jgi:lipopolysaccharide/colanic/teichoic acid biosynthesis glycosyltransferase